MKIYIASRYARREELKGYAEKLEKLGYVITSDWLNEVNESFESIDRCNAARICLRGLTETDVYVQFTHDLENIDPKTLTKEEFVQYARGGRQVELGFAMAWGVKRIIFVGPRENIFHYIEDMEQCNNFDELVTLLEKTED